MKQKLFKKGSHARQGDVLIEKIEPVEGKKTDEPVILAHGEVTGHSHQIYDSGASLLEINWKGTKTRGLEIKKHVKVQHQEHGAIKLNKGTYRVIQQREYSPEEIRNVRD